jgi:threonine dehydrogenase-like Zn-dependent dehydrogenase
MTLDPTRCDVGLEIKNATDKRGVDVAIEASGSYHGLQAAIRCAHYSGLVVTLGYYRGEGIGLRLGEEWHHNRITLLSSMPVWENPSRDHPMWNNERVDAVLARLMQAGKLSGEGLVQPIVPFDEVVEAYKMIDEHPEQSIKFGVRYPG